MATSARSIEIDPNDPAFSVDLPNPDDTPQFNSTVARLVWEAGHHSRAWRIENCGEYKVQKCEDGHNTRTHRFCDCRTCVDECADKAAKDLVERYQIDADHAIMNSRCGNYAPRFTFIDFRFQCEHTHDAIHDLSAATVGLLREKQHYTRADMRLSRKEVRPARRYPLVLWAYSAGFDDAGFLVLRVLFLDSNIDPDDLRNGFGAVSADVHVVPMKSIHKFMPLLFATAIPSTDAARADMEIAFIRIRRLRTIGQFEVPEVAELFVEEGDGKTSTINSDTDSSTEEGNFSSPDDSPPTKKPRLCPVCHKNIVAESGWFPRYTPIPRPEDTTYYSVPI